MVFIRMVIYTKGIEGVILIMSVILNSVTGLKVSGNNNCLETNKVYKCDKALEVYSIVQYASVCAPLAT